MEWKKGDKSDGVTEKVKQYYDKATSKFVSSKPNEGCWLKNDYSSNIGKERV